MEACRSLREELLEEGISFGFETVASTQEKLDFVKKAKQRGYEILLLFVTAGSPEKCCERIRQRVAAGGHVVPREKVFSRYQRTLTYLPEYIELADRAEIFDNSDALVRVCSKTDGKVTITPEGSSLEWVRRYLSRYI
jgi:predicted ABC-type ATPase